MTTACDLPIDLSTKSQHHGHGHHLNHHHHHTHHNHNHNHHHLLNHHHLAAATAAANHHHHLVAQLNHEQLLQLEYLSQQQLAAALASQPPHRLLGQSGVALDGSGLAARLHLDQLERIEQLQLAAASHQHQRPLSLNQQGAAGGATSHHLVESRLDEGRLICADLSRQFAQQQHSHFQLQLAAHSHRLVGHQNPLDYLYHSSAAGSQSAHLHHHHRHLQDLSQLANSAVSLASSGLSSFSTSSCASSVSSSSASSTNEPSSSPATTSDAPAASPLDGHQQPALTVNTNSLGQSNLVAAPSSQANQSGQMEQRQLRQDSSESARQHLGLHSNANGSEHGSNSENPSPIDLHRSSASSTISTISSPSSSSASISSTSSTSSTSLNLQLHDKKRINRPLTGKHVKHGTGASVQTLNTLRKLIRQRQQLAVK